MRSLVNVTLGTVLREFQVEGFSHCYQVEVFLQGFSHCNCYRLIECFSFNIVVHTCTLDFWV